MRSLRTRASALLSLFGLLVASCSGGPTESERVAQVTLSLASLNLDALGATQTVTAIARDADFSQMTGVTITWSTSQASVATVSPTGLITAVSNGTATITASAGNVSTPLPVTVQQVAVAPAVVSGGDQSAPVSSALPQPIVVRVGDRLGNVMGGIAVTFAVSSGGGSITTTNATPGADGLAQTSWTLGPLSAQLQRLTVTAAGANGATVVSAIALAGPPASAIASVSSPTTGQAARVGTAVERRPAVVLRDSSGNLVANGAVTFSVVSGGGSITGGSALSNTSGVATVGGWTVGPDVGPNVLRATIPGLPAIDFTVRGVASTCVPDGANLVALNVTYSGTITTQDCVDAADNIRYDFYRLDLAQTTAVIIEMDGTGLDAFLFLYNFNTLDSIAAHDDIIPGVNQDARIAMSLGAGSYLIRARTYDAGQTGSYTLVARSAELGVPTQLVIVDGQGQRVAPGATVPVAPAVAVRDEAGVGVAGVTVNFATVSGVGAITGASAVTDVNGIARVGSWTLAAGANVLSATAVASGLTGNPAVISATGKAAAPTAGFDISLRFVNMPTPSQLQTFSSAATRWETIITSDLPAAPVQFEVGTCNSHVAGNETIDDVAIVVRLEPIDGSGSVLGSAGPCLIRNTGFLPAFGTMRFDTADLANLEASGNFGNVILHEMGHVLGIGTLWSANFANRLQLPSPVGGPPQDTHFNGPTAIAGFLAIGGGTYSGGQLVPVENTGSGGTINSHWRESILLNELMTGFINAGANPLSRVTIGSLADVGYTVDLAAADNFAITPVVMAEGAASPARVEMKDDVYKGPVYRLDATGWPIGVPKPLAKRPKGQR